MIRDAIEKDKNSIYSMWQSSFSIKNSDELNCFFNHVLDEGNCVVNEIDDHIVSTVFMKDFVVRLKNHSIKSTYLSHIATHPDYRHAGYMSECMKSALDECENKVLFTFVEASNPKLWESFGFQTAVVHRVYELYPENFDSIEIKGIKDNVSADILKQIYDEFIQLFDGYKERTLQDFEHMILEATQCHDRLLVVYNGEKPVGYIRARVVGLQVKVKEIVYLGSIALQILLVAALGNRNSIILEVSEAERLEKIFPLAIARKKLAIMVRCNNLPLFNKLYNERVKTSKDAYAIGKKPRYLNERF